MHQKRIQTEDTKAKKAQVFQPEPLYYIVQYE